MDIHCHTTNLQTSPLHNMEGGGGRGEGRERENRMLSRYTISNFGNTNLIKLPQSSQNNVANTSSHKHLIFLFSMSQLKCTVMDLTMTSSPDSMCVCVCVCVCSVVGHIVLYTCDYVSRTFSLYPYTFIRAQMNRVELNWLSNWVPSQSVSTLVE